MYLKRLVIHGFKSFADRTVLELEPGVTGIVGPNGCGKSNVADAIKWVLGEQSPKSLRASSMQDVLFEGADTRPAMSFAEVSLLFTDCEKELGTAFNEVEVGRRVERDGGSDYFINGKACRLKDIQQLFRDTGIGRVAYSFLQQGQIDRLLSSNPMDRRAVFEEAAGISGFKAKREETLRKLTDVEGNLSRLGDILTEVSSQMASLKRQAAKALRAQRLKKQLNALDQALIAYDLQNIDGQIAQKNSVLAPLESRLSDEQAKLTQHEESIKTLEEKMGELIGSQQQLSNAIFEKRSLREEALSHARFLTLRSEEALSRIAGLEQTLAAYTNEASHASAEVEKISTQLNEARALAEAAREKVTAATATHEASQKAYEETMAQEMELRSAATESEGRLSAMEAKRSAMELESHGLQAQLGPINAQKETLKAEAERIRAEESQAQMHATLARQSAEQLAQAQAHAQAQQQTLRQQNAAQKEIFAQAQHAHVELLAERNLLEELNRRYEGFSAATQTLLKSGEYAPLVEGLRIAPHATTAISALLSVELEAVTPRTGNALGIAQMQAGERVALTRELPTAETPLVEGLQRAQDLIEASPNLSFIRNRLAGCYVCADEARFAQIVEGRAGFDFVAVANAQGALIDSRGLFIGSLTAAGEPTHAASYLTRSQRIQALAELIAQSESQLQTAKSELTRLDHELTHNETTLGKISQELSATLAQVENFESSTQRASASLARVEEQLAALDSQTSASQKRLEELTQERTQLQKDLEELVLKKNMSDERARELVAALGQLRSQRDEAAAALTEARLADANARHNVEVAQEALRNADARQKDFAARIQAAQAEVSRLSADVEDCRQQAQQKSAVATQQEKELESLEGQMGSLKAELDQQELLCQDVRQQLTALRQSVGQAQNELMRARLEMGELQSRRTMLMEDLERRWGQGTDVATLNWRASLFEAQSFAKADEETLETQNLALPSADDLAAAYPQLDREALMVDTQTIRQKLENIGPVNESALEDYAQHEARYSQMRAQVDDLTAAKTELTNALMELESQSSTLFASTFEVIRTNFAKTFEQLFGGGKADLQLSDPNDPLNSGIDILARPPGTQLKALGLLSGGQKTMTAVALLFAIYQVKPSPFCVLDELDAPLDDANIGRFLAMLKGFTAFSQFVIITHNKRTMAACDILYGVTMAERGVSRIVSMRLSQAESFSKPAPQEEQEKAAPVKSPEEKRDDAHVEAAVEVAASYSLDALKEKVAEALKEEKVDEKVQA